MKGAQRKISSNFLDAQVPSFSSCDKAQYEEDNYARKDWDGGWEMGYDI